MADPTKYTPGYSFTGFEVSNPEDPKPGTSLDGEFAAIRTSIDTAVEAIKDVRRADGAIANNSIGPDQLSAALSIGFTLEGNWALSTVYEAGDGVAYNLNFYKARTQHTSTNANRPDVDSTTWAFLFAFSAITVSDGSITAVKLAAGDAAAFRTVFGQKEIVAEGMAAVSAKTTLVDADTFAAADSAASGALVTFSWANLKSKLFTALGLLISGGTAKATVVDADTFALSDSESSSATKSLSFSVVKSTILSTIAAWVIALAAKTVPADADLFNIVDIAGGNVSSKVTFAQMRNALRLASVGSHSNLGLSATVNASALTVALKGADGNDPSATNPVYLCFRSATLTDGKPTIVALTAATSIVISSGSTMGFANSTPGRLWLVAFYDAGTIRPGLINCLNSKSITPLRSGLRASSTAEGGAGAADSAGVFYTGTAVSSKDYIVLGSLDWASGLATAGTWASAPTTTAIQQPGMPLPGDIIQRQRTDSGAVISSTTDIPVDDTIPQITEGDELITQAITPMSALNVLDVKCSLALYCGNSDAAAAALFRDSTANALAAVMAGTSLSSEQAWLTYTALAGSVSATTFRARAGLASASSNTLTFNGQNGSRRFGGVSNSYIEVTEIVA